jgi:hypothetical protein
LDREGIKEKQHNAQEELDIWVFTTLRHDHSERWSAL